MEERILKQITTTTLAFPLYIYKTTIKYNEVRKASGIAYIILDLLLKSEKNDEPICDVLLEFGIPKDMHYIFGKEIANLISTDIIASRYSPEDFNGRFFNVIRFSELKLTEKGKKLFREGAIPTGIENTTTKDIFYSPVTRKFDIGSARAYADFSTSFLGLDFLNHIDIDISGMEDYINSNPTKVGLKAEERMISYLTDEPEKKQIRKEDGMKIIIRPSGVEYVFETSDETEFFYKYYTSKNMTDGMIAKSKYKFLDENKSIINVPNISISDLKETDNVYIPYELPIKAEQPCKLFVNRNKLKAVGHKSSIKIDVDESQKILDLVNKDVEFALLNIDSCRLYIPYKVSMPCKRLGDIFEIQLLIERKATPEEFININNYLYKTYSEKSFDYDTGKIVLFVIQALNNKEMYKEYTQKVLSNYKTVDEKIDALLKIDSVFEKAEGWKDYFNEIGEKLFNQSCSEIKLDNMIYKKTVLLPIKDKLGMQNKDFINYFVNTTKGVENDELIFQALSTAEFSTNEILGVTNVIGIYMNYVLNNKRTEIETDLSVTFDTLRINMWKLNNMLGVEHYSNYSLKDDYNVDDFFNVYSTFQLSLSRVEKYRLYAEEEYKQLNQYAKIYEPIHDILSIERTASSHPDKLTKTYINDCISRGKYKEAICDLVVKMQYDLRKILNLDDQAKVNDMINFAKDKHIVDRNTASDLHELRICRNNFQHPGKEQVTFNKSIIENWRDTVFSLKGE